MCLEGIYVIPADHLYDTVVSEMSNNYNVQYVNLMRDADYLTLTNLFSCAFNTIIQKNFVDQT